MVHISDVFSESFSLMAETLSEIYSTLFGKVALLMNIMKYF